MDTKQLVYILTIAEEGGITKAAGRLFITQSALDQQLLKLEKELGTQLFHRSRSHFTLTEAGRVYVDYAKRMLGLKDEAYRIIHDLSDRQKGTLSLAFAPERGMEMFMAVYPRFYEAYPEVNIVPREIGVKRQLEMLRSDELDLGFVSMPEQSIPELVCTSLLREEFVLITPPDHPLARLAAPPGAPLATAGAEVLRGLTLSLMYRESTQRKVIDALFAHLGCKPDIFLETASNRANISMVQKGLSCSIVPHYYVKGMDHKEAAVLRLKERPTWDVLACYKRSRYFTKAARHFIALAEEYFKQEPAGLT